MKRTSILITTLVIVLLSTLIVFIFSVSNFSNDVSIWSGEYIDPNCVDGSRCYRVTIDIEEMLLNRNGQRYKGTGDVFPVKIVKDFNGINEITVGDDTGHYRFVVEGSWLYQYKRMNDADVWKLDMKLIRIQK